MAEPIEELAVRLVADGSDFLDFIDDAVTQAEEELGRIPEAAEEAASALSDRLREAGMETIQTAELLGLTLEEAAKSLEGMALAGGFTAEELVQAAQRIDQEAAGVIEAAMLRIVQAAEEGGIQLTTETLDRFRSFFEAIVESARRVEIEGADAVQAGLETIVMAAEEAGMKFSEAQEQGIEAYLETIAEVGDHVPAAAAAIEQMTGAIEGQIKATSEAMREQSSAGSDLSGVVKGLTQDFGRFFRQLISGIGVVALLRKGLQFVTESVQVAAATQQSMFRLTQAIQAQQRAQGESAGTMQEWIGFAKQIVDEFGRPLERTMLDVAASVNLMSINLDLSGEQMQTLIRSGTALANIHSQNIEPVMRRLVQFIQGGYVVGLRELGIVIDDTILRETAHALRIQGNIDEWTAAEAQLVRYTVLLNQSAFALESASQRTGTLAGRQDDVNQSWDNAKNLLGQSLLPAWVAIQEVMAAAITTLTQWIFLIEVNLVNATALAVASFAALLVGMNDFRNGVLLGTVSVGEAFQHMQDIFVDTFRTLQSEGFQNLTGDLGQFTDVAEDEFGSLGDSAEEMEGRVVEAFKKSSEAIEDAMRAWEEGVSRAQQRLSDRLEDIETDFGDRIFDLQVDLQRDLADIDRDAAQDRIDTIIEAQVDEIRLREDHARRVQQLEMRYLFDLEDAVRERDARQVLMLQRRFNMERQELEDEFDLADKRRKEDLAKELADIERRRQIRRAERVRAFQEELADAELMRQRRREDAQREYERDLRDLRVQIERRLRMEAEAIQSQLKLNAKGLQALYDQLNQAYGPGGWVEAFYRRYAQIVGQAASSVAAYSSAIGAGVGASVGSNDPYTGRRAGSTASPGYLGGYQRGGTLYATSPGMFMAGEGRPERIDVTPLSRAGGVGRDGGGGFGGRAVIEVRVDASDRLMVEVADFVENDMADIFINVNRGQEQARGAIR